MRELSATAVQRAVVAMVIDANCRISPQVLQQMERCRAEEQQPLAASILGRIIENDRLAAERCVPMCQDTGMAVFRVQLGQELHITGGSLEDAIQEGVRLFTSKSIYAITHTSDFTLADMGSKKQALFVILPDEKTTFYPIASLIVSQQYELLAEAADRRGGRLERRVNFILDEYGNFTPISDMTNKLTVAAGRGMRYALFVQGFDQLKEKYSDNIANTIKGNCQVWAYLQSDDPETLREMSDKLGSYTTSSYQLSASNGKYTTPSNSQSVSLTERKLLNTDEVRRVKRPHQIITSRDHPAMMYAPDLSQWMFNKMLGLGDMEHNRRLREEREQKRPIITDTKQEIALWNIWIYYQKDIMRRLSQQKGAMGGGLDDD